MGDLLELEDYCVNGELIFDYYNVRLNGSTPIKMTREFCDNATKDEIVDRFKAILTYGVIADKEDDWEWD